jgi:lactoylglutathione lyase
MITHIANVTAYVTDQDRAVDFYVNKLGFEKRRDNPMGPPGSPRWIEVAPKGEKTAILLYKPTKEAPGASSYELAVSLIGKFTNFMFEVKDMEATCSALKEKGVAFVDPPKKQPYGWWATIQDPDGNTIGMHAQ